MKRAFYSVLFFFVFILSSMQGIAQVTPPRELHQFSRATSYAELSLYVKQLDESSDLLTVETTGQSVEGRNLYALYYSENGFGKDPSKIKVLIFAQQHGNEQSGKEGALWLASELLQPENRYLFSKIDLVLVPQVNPDGSEVNKRRNGNNMDLNRNHLILTEPETETLHRLFNRYLFDVTLDVHEYYPYDSVWQSLGFRKNTEVTVGGMTNINISSKLRKFSRKKALPYLINYVSGKGFSSFEYLPGGPPEENYLRRSTFDINDGRQSFGIQNTLSFIQEGRNGTDSYMENLEKRAMGQAAGIRGFLEFTCQNAKKIKKMVKLERFKLLHPKYGQPVSVQMIHAASGEILQLPVYSYKSMADSTILVKNFRPVVKTLADVEKPYGYLIPEDLPQLKEWSQRHQLEMYPFEFSRDYVLEQYHIQAIDSIDFELDIIINPNVDNRTFELEPLSPSYLFIPTAQLKGNMIVTALEPKSMLGLATYKEFEFLIRPDTAYPILRVEKK